MSQPLSHSAIVVRVSQIVVVRVKIQAVAKVQPRQTPKYSQFYLFKSSFLSLPPSLHVSLRVVSFNFPVNFFP